MAQTAFVTRHVVEDSRISRRRLADHLNEMVAEGLTIMDVTTLKYETKPNGHNHGHGYDVRGEFLVVAYHTD